MHTAEFIKKRAKNKNTIMSFPKMVSCWKLLIFFTSSLITRAICEQKHILIQDSKYETFVHNLEQQYFLDKGETIQVWTELTPFPWEDNRLMAGISDPTLLEFNASSEEKVVSKGVVARNLTALISQFGTDGESLYLDNKGNATFFIEIFNETENIKPIRAETAISVGCPPGRIMTISRNSDECSLPKRYKGFSPSFHVSNFSIKDSQNETEQYNFTTLGCPIDANYYDLFKPALHLYGDSMFLREVTADYVLYELNGRTDYSYSATMKQARCLQEAQTWRNMSGITNAPNSWNRQNYKPCFVLGGIQAPNLDQPYEILNQSGLSAIVWENEGIYVFKATVVDPGYSYCNLTTTFAVHVYGIMATAEGLPPFLVLGTSILALTLSVGFLFFTSNYMLQE